MGKPRTALDLLAADEARTIRVAGMRALNVEKRDAIESNLVRPSMRFLDALGARSTSGAPVNDNSASTVPTFLACARLFSDMLGMLPCKLYQKTADGREERTEHPASKLVSRAPSEAFTPYEVRRLAQIGVCYGGNGYMRVWRDAYNDPAELQWLPPCDVKPEGIKRADGRIRKEFQVEGEKEPLTSADIIHIQNVSLNGIVGISPVRVLRESLGLSITQRDQSSQIYANGARFPGYLTAPPSMTKVQVDDARVEWQAKQAGAANAGKNPILWGGWTYVATQGMTMQDAEFLESRKFERSEIATMFGVPEVLLGNSDKASSWGTGIETLTNGFLTFALGPWLTNWEERLDYTLLTVAERAADYYFRFNRGALLQLTKEAQAKFFREMRDIGVYSVNDVRRFLEENDLPDHIGDDYRLPFNGSGGTPAEPPGAKKPTEKETE